MAKKSYRQTKEPGLKSVPGWLMPVIASVGVALLLFAVVSSAFPRLPIIHDAYGYTMSAQRLAYHRYFAFSTELPATRVEPNAFTTPGYVVALAACYALGADASTEGVPAAQVMHPWVVFGQLLLVLGLVAAVCSSGYVLGRRGLAYVSGLLAAVYLPFGWSATVALSEVLGAFLVAVQMLLALLIADRKNRRTWPLLAGFGAVSAALALVRPALVLWAIAPFIYLAIRRFEPWRRLLRSAAIAAVAFVLVMSPWWVRNVVTLDRFVALSTGAGNPMLLSTGGLEMTPQEQQIADAATARGADGEVAVATARLRAQFAAGPADFVKRRAVIAWSVVRGPWRPPLDVLREENYQPDVVRVDWGPFSKIPTRVEVFWLKLSETIHSVLLAGAAIGLAFSRRSPRLLLVASFPVYLVLVHSFTLFSDRYFFPAMPAMVILAAAGFYGVVRLGVRGVRSRMPVAQG